MKALNCIAPMVIGNYSISVNGMFVGCLPITSLLHSSLSCFYNETCFTQIQAALESNTTHFTQKLSALDPTVPSRFEQNTPLGTIVKSLMIEEWSYTLNYSSYFDQCKVSSCTYTLSQRNSVLEIALKVLGLCE